MENIIYINNDEIQIFRGKRTKDKIVIKNFEVIPLEEESVLNCMIFKEDIVIETLKRFRKKVNNCVIILESTNIYAKRLTFPKLSKKQIKNLIRNEFMLSDSGDEFIYDANIKFDHKLSDVICCAVPKSMILSYVNIFKQSGIKIKRIDIAINGFIKYIKTFRELSEGAFVFNVMSKKTLLSMLFHDGRFILANRSRISDEPDNQEFLFSVYSRLSTMVQFSKSEKTLEKSEFEITKSLYTGLLSSSIESLQGFTDEIAIRPMHDTGSEAYRLMLDASIYPLTGLFKDKDDINILKAFETLGKTGASTGQRIAKIILFAACVFAAGVSLFFAFMANTVLKDEISSLNFALAANSAVSSEIATLEAKQSSQRNKIAALEAILSSIENLSAMDRTTIETILKTASSSLSIEHITYTAATPSISINGLGATEYDASDFVVRLKKTGLFSDVTYTGYEQRASDNGSMFGFNVQAVLKRGLDGE